MAKSQAKNNEEEVQEGALPDEQLTPMERASEERFAPVNDAEGRPDPQAAAESGAADPFAFGPEVQVAANEEGELGPVGSATQTGGTSYYAATDIKPAYATPYYPPTDYNFAVIDAGMITADDAINGYFTAVGLAAGDPYPAENDVQDTIETDGRANDAAVLEVKDWHRRPHPVEFGIIAAFRRADGGLPYPVNPNTGGGAAGVVQDVEAPV